MHCAYGYDSKPMESESAAVHLKIVWIDGCSSPPKYGIICVYIYIYLFVYLFDLFIYYIVGYDPTPNISARNL